MKVLITGGAGFLGNRLAKKLLQRGSLKNAAGQDEKIEQLVLFDKVAAEGIIDPRVSIITGNIADPACVKAIVDDKTSAIFHLAAIVSSQAEADFDLGMQINIDAFRLLLETCRERGHCPKLIFTSSVAVYGGALPEVVQDTTALNPKSSYGIQKAIGELMLADFSRRGFIDGRGLRLPTISVRPGKPNKAASSFASAIIREPLHDENTVCPVHANTRLWLLSPRQAVESLIRAHDAPAAGFTDSRMLNLPGINVSVQQMLDALKTVAGAQAEAKIRWEADETIQRIVGSWPACWNTDRARALGFLGDADFETIIRSFIEDEKSA